mgnify:CR=1 FL=1
MVELQAEQPPTAGQVDRGQVESAQRQVLEAILRSLRQRGMPPILEEIAEAIGLDRPRGALVTDVPDGPALDAGVLAGDVMQVVPAQRMSCPFQAPALDLYRALRYLNPSPYMFYLDLGDFHIAGSSPEILTRAEQGCEQQGQERQGQSWTMTRRGQQQPQFSLLEDA